MNDLNNDEDNLNTREGESIIEPLAEDNDTPFSAPDTPIDDPNENLNRQFESSQIDSTHQKTDTNIDPHEVYDEGLSGGAEAEEPNAGNAVVDYNPPSEEEPKRDSSP